MTTAMTVPPAFIDPPRDEVSRRHFTNPCRVAETGEYEDHRQLQE
jgi:hypothetical protein